MGELYPYGSPCLEPRSAGKEAFMLRTNHRFTRNPFFHFHPMHSAFSLLGALVLLALLVWMFILVPPVR